MRSDRPPPPGRNGRDCQLYPVRSASEPGPESCTVMDRLLFWLTHEQLPARREGRRQTLFSGLDGLCGRFCCWWPRWKICRKLWTWPQPRQIASACASSRPGSCTSPANWLAGQVNFTVNAVVTVLKCFLRAQEVLLLPWLGLDYVLRLKGWIFHGAKWFYRLFFPVMDPDP